MNQGLPYDHTSPWWAPPWLGRALVGLRSIMVLPPPRLRGMADQTRTTSAIRNDPNDIYGTRLFANWASGTRGGVDVAGAVAFAPITAGTDVGIPDPGSDLSWGGTGRHPGNERAPSGPQATDHMILPYYGQTPYLRRRDASSGDESPRIGDERNQTFTDQSLQTGPNPDSSLTDIPGSFRIPRQFRMGLAHMAGPSQWGMPQHWDGGKRGDTLNIKPPLIPATDGTNARAVRGILGSVRAADSTHIPAVFTPASIG